MYGNILELAKKVLTRQEYRAFQYTFDRACVTTRVSSKQFCRKANIPYQHLEEILKEAGHKVNVALDQERRSGDPEISEVLAVNGGEEYISVMEFILYEKKFGGTNDPEMARFRIQKGGRLDDEEVGYFYMPFQEFRAFKGTRLERALREYKKRQASSKK